jgi:membrane protease subunit (stomatin/prohibitin family)
MIVVGIFFGWLFCLGGLLVLVGFIVLIVGLVETEKPKTVIQYYGQPQAGYGAQGTQIQYQTGPSGTINFCPNCGQQVVPGAVRCPRCGRGLTG